MHHRFSRCANLRFPLLALLLLLLLRLLFCLESSAALFSFFPLLLLPLQSLCFRLLRDSASTAEPLIQVPPGGPCLLPLAPCTFCRLHFPTSVGQFFLRHPFGFSFVSLLPPSFSVFFDLLPRSLRASSPGPAAMPSCPSARCAALGTQPQFTSGNVQAYGSNYVYCKGWGITGYAPRLPWVPLGRLLMILSSLSADPLRLKIRLFLFGLCATCRSGGDPGLPPPCFLFSSPR